jgi:small lipoprotein (TIGR04452 family)
MKLIINILLCVILQCQITNTFYLKPSRVKGKDAKVILQNRLASFFVKDITDSNIESLKGDFLMPVIAKIEDDGIYRRREIENCATRIFLLGVAIDQPSIIYNRNKRASQPTRGSDPNSRIIPPLFCSIKKVDATFDLD